MALFLWKSISLCSFLFNIYYKRMLRNEDEGYQATKTELKSKFIRETQILFFVSLNLEKQKKIFLG